MSKYVFAFRSDPDRAATPAEEEAWTAWFGELGGAVTAGRGRRDHGNVAGRGPRRRGRGVIGRGRRRRPISRRRRAGNLGHAWQDSRQ